MLFGIHHPNCMQMRFHFYLLLITLYQPPTTNYQRYHQRVLQAEEHLIDSAYRQALDEYTSMLTTYDFIFVRDLKIATQVAWLVRDTAMAIHFLEKGMLAGWERKEIRRTDFLDALRLTNAYRELDKKYPTLRSQYESSLDQTLRKQVQRLFKQDQWKALGALLRIGRKAKDRYTERRFAPQSEEHLQALSTILETHGYPGERLIGNNYWGETILSHHNSISE